MHTTLRVIKTF